VAQHPDDEFHTPTSDDPYWTETCWFTFHVPERKISGQLYPYFSANQGTCAAGAFMWDEHGSHPYTALYAKMFWHLPMPQQPLTDITVPNGIRYKCLEPQKKWEVNFDDPDGDELTIRLTFTAVAPPNYMAGSHIDQPGRVQGTITLYGEEIPVDSYGFRDRSWSVRSQFGESFGHIGYTYGAADDGNGFHIIEQADQEAFYHGHFLQDGTWSKLVDAHRKVLERSPETGFPTKITVEGTDELGRNLYVEGTALNGCAIQLNPNLLSIDSLMEYSFAGGLVGHGADHDDWNAHLARRYFRGLLGYDQPSRAG
jgi:hypothetical protein